jgi:hypothetical protein
MNENFENELRNALRPVDAPEGLADRIMRSLPPREAAAPAVVLSPVRTPESPARTPRRYWMPGALAASLLVAVLTGTHMAQLRDERIAREEGLAARRELLQALRLTSEKLDLAYHAVQAAPAKDAIDEENRS